MSKSIGILLLFIVHNLFADPVGTVLFTTKKVIAQQKGVERALSRGSSLHEGDAIATAADATIKFRYANGTLVTLGGSSNYKIIAYAPPQSDVIINAELNKGKMQSETVGKKKREALKTSVVALAITGTKYNVFSGSKTNTNVEVIKGTIEAGGRAWGVLQSFKRQFVVCS